MGRKAADPNLYKLATKLKEPGTFHQYSALKDEAEDLWKDNELRNVFLMRDSKTFAVKMFLGNAQRIIGYSTNLADACRFADLARWRFAQYRLRDQREPTESDLNFPIQQVKNDLAQEPKANALLSEIENYLISLDVFHTGVRLHGSAVEVERRTTVRHEFNARFTEVEDQFDALAEMIQKQSAQLNRIEQAIELFKRDRFVREQVDIVDAKIIPSESAEDNTSTMKVDNAAFDQAHGLTPIGANPAPEPLPPEKVDELLGDIFTIDQSTINPN